MLIDEFFIKYMSNNYSRILLISVLFFQLLAVGFLDYFSGYEVKLGALYAFPVAFAAWYVGRYAGLFAAIACALIALWAEKAAGKVYSSEWIALANTSSRLAIFLFVHFSIGYFRRTVDLANKRMRAFEGNLPVCCRCHRVDGGDGFWTDFPTFLRNNTQAEVEFKTCPSCQKAPAKNQTSSS